MTDEPDRTDPAGTPRDPGPTESVPSDSIPAESSAAESIPAESSAAESSAAEPSAGPEAPDSHLPADQPSPSAGSGAAAPAEFGAAERDAAAETTAAEPAATEPRAAEFDAAATTPVTSEPGAGGPGATEPPAAPFPPTAAQPSGASQSGAGQSGGGQFGGGHFGGGRPGDPRLAGGAYPPPNYPPPNYPPPNYPPPGYGPSPGQVPPGDGPRFGTPPPGGWGFAPGTDGYATRYGLARPAQGRVIAGVCAAVGRATNTDPVLWRVLIAVFSLAGGLGIVLYLLGWLFIPAEGDSGSPVEALFGRGRTRANPIAIVAVAVGAAIGLSIVVSANHFWSAFVVVGIIVALVVYGTRNGNVMTGRSATPMGGPVPPPVPPPGQPVYSTATAPAPPGPYPPTYRPPFAPHGPYQQQQGRPGYAGPVPPVQPVPPLPPQPRPPKPPKQRSKLGLLTVSVALLACGVLGLGDLGGWSVPFTAYLAVALTVVGLGMLVGTWLGRARGLIGLGLVLAAVLGISAVTSHVDDGFHGGAGNVTWAPASITDLSDKYEHGFGDVVLDLSQIDFSDSTRTVELRVNAGDTRVIVPQNVDVVVHARIDAGNADVFDQHWDGVNTGTHTVTDLGTDGAGGGHLTLDIRVNAGQLEVQR